MGCDPEFFFQKGKGIIGSEKVIPQAGLKTAYGDNKIIIDGVQAEMNPGPASCRQHLAGNLRECFKAIYGATQQHGVSVNLSQTVEIEKDELMSLDEKSRKFGCAPSKNLGKDKASIKSINAEEYMFRSAGGHIHIELSRQYDDYGDLTDYSELKKQPERLVQMYDIIVGNTCVLIDRDPGNIERRKVYGRAGEYRTPRHGIEYRTPSNFWLRSYPLMSLVFGLARLATSIVAQSTPAHDYEKIILSKIKRANITRAINNNDYKLAMRNWKKISKVLVKLIPANQNYSFVVNSNTLKEFNYFVEKGMDYWFKDDPIQHWMKLEPGSARGIERFLSETVREDMKKNKK